MFTDKDKESRELPVQFEFPEQRSCCNVIYVQGKAVVKNSGNCTPVQVAVKP